eukprot:58122-Rhodomonas_salina.1
MLRETSNAKGCVLAEDVSCHALKETQCSRSTNKHTCRWFEGLSLNSTRSSRASKCVQHCG